MPDSPSVLRRRHDGWTAERQAAFVAAIVGGKSVGDAAAAAGMSRMAPYRLAKHPSGTAFAEAWKNATNRRQNGDSGDGSAFVRGVVRFNDPFADDAVLPKHLMRTLNDMIRREKRRFHGNLCNVPQAPNPYRAEKDRFDGKLCNLSPGGPALALDRDTSPAPRCAPASTDAAALRAGRGGRGEI